MQLTITDDTHNKQCYTVCFYNVLKRNKRNQKNKQYIFLHSYILCKYNQITHFSTFLPFVIFPYNIACVCVYNKIHKSWARDHMIHPNVIIKKKP